MLETLRVELESLYPTVDDIRRIVEQAGIDPSYVDFNGSASTIWYRAVSEAERRNRLGNLVEVVAKDYPENRTIAEVFGFIKYSPAADRVGIGGEHAYNLTSGVHPAVAHQLREIAAKIDAVRAVLDRRLTVAEVEIVNLKDGMRGNTRDDSFNVSQSVVVTIGFFLAAAVFIAMVWMLKG